ncbi:MAG: phosphoenolpyruvate carboxykinase [Candidatus Izimaplasma sp.]|nr:phosphoenolpyruvate carboxykinase [Candidatus Izimaplasma bacterium]
MIKEYSQNRNNAILNLSVKYCSTQEELLSSKAFNKVLKSFIEKQEEEDSLLLENLESQRDGKDLSHTISTLYRLLTSFAIDEIKNTSKIYYNFLTHNDLLEFTQKLYDYWRGLERYAIIQTNGNKKGMVNVNFIEASNNFSNLVLSTFRKIEGNLKKVENNVYRQLQAGYNAGLVLSNFDNNLPAKYDYLNEVNTIKKIILTPPLIVYPSRNTRSGLFEEVYSNPLKEVKMRMDHYFCYPAKVGKSLTYVYFHRDFMNHGIALSNLFELASEEDLKSKKSDIILVFGGRVKNNPKRTVYFDDKENDVLVGLVSNCDEIDYFGYMKKMILTLHNTKMINQQELPIHGAMVNITLKNNKKANVAIIGDSGAGKSESLEAFRKLSKDYLKEIKFIFDDMGSFKIKNNEVYGYGTETGAFVRLDDLELGYSFQAMDRAIFMNPHRDNARLLIPISDYETITKGFKVDILLYANNYTERENVLTFFKDKQDAIDVFVKGQRKAKGTTSEEGIVSSFFGNPFGPAQRQTETKVILDNIFDKLYENNIPVGEIYTKLAIKGKEQSGPEDAAKQLFKWIREN